VEEVLGYWIKLDDFFNFYRSLNLTVFPLAPRSKEPREGLRWKDLSKEELLTVFEKGDNLAVRIEKPFFVIDCDEKKLLRLFLDEVGQTLIVETRRGYHLYLKSKGNYYPKANLQSKCVQLLAATRYAVAPPSVVDGHQYRFISKGPIAELDESKVRLLETIIEFIAKHEKIILEFSRVWTEGHRHNLSLWLNGALRKTGIPKFEAGVIVKSICLLADDPEITDRLRALHDTFMKPLSEIAAWSKLKEELSSFLGPDEAEGLFKILPQKFNIEVRPLSEVVAEARPIDWIIEGLIPKYGFVILAGKAGVGKSFLSLHLAHCVASGGSFLGVLPVAVSGKVLLIDNENYPGIYKQRVEALKLNPLDDIDVVVMENFSLDHDRCLNWLEGVLGENRYRLIIFDAWTNLVSKTDENKATDVSRVLSRLRKISYDHECCFVLIHHLRKNLPFAVEAKDEIRGSSVLVNEADIVLLLQSFKDSKILKTIKQRYGEEQTFEIQFEKSDEKLLIKGKPVVFEDFQSEVVKALEAIAEYIEAKGNPATRRELIESLPFPEGTLKRALNLGVNLGRIVRTGRGIYALPAKLEQFV